MTSKSRQAAIGASPGETLLYIILPLSHAGIVAGVVFTLVPLMTAFVEPQTLSGGFVNLLGETVDSGLQTRGCRAQFPTACRRL